MKQNKGIEGLKSKNLIDVGKHAPEEPEEDWSRTKKPVVKHRRRRTIKLNEDDESAEDDAAARLRRRGSGGSEQQPRSGSPGSPYLTMQ